MRSTFILRWAQSLVCDGSVHVGERQEQKKEGME